MNGKKSKSIIAIVIVIILVIGGFNLTKQNHADHPKTSHVAKKKEPTVTLTKDLKKKAPKKQKIQEEETSDISEKSEPDSDSNVDTNQNDDNKEEVETKAFTPTPSVPTEYYSALSSANSYSSNLHMSKRGIYDQLVSEYGENFSPAAAQYAIDHMYADWNHNALLSAQSYQENLQLSPEEIRDQLTSEYGEQFEQSEADYAVSNL